MRTRSSNLHRLFFPSSVAVVGVGQSGLGRLVHDHIVAAGFKGNIWGVHPTLKRIDSTSVYPTLQDIPETPELVVVSVSKKNTPQVIEDAAQAGCAASIIVSGGFAETGQDGARVQDRIVSIAKNAGMRLLGPNCMGLINTHPEARLHAAFGVGPAETGSIAILTQSGSVGDYFLYHAKRWGVGTSSLVSFGNEADITIDELLDVAKDDDRTQAIVCYIEQPAHPEKLLESLEVVTKIKPVIVLKGGQTKLGAGAASSHTGRLSESAGGAPIEALIRDTGAHIVDGLEEMMAVSKALSLYPSGFGRNVSFVTNAGGPGVLALDQLEKKGVNRVTTGTISHDDERFPKSASLNGPVLDLTASAQPEHYEAAVGSIGKAADAIVVMIMSPEGTDPLPCIKSVLDVAPGPVFFCLLATGSKIERTFDFIRQKDGFVTTDPKLIIEAIGLCTERQLWLEDLSRSRLKARKKDFSIPHEIIKKISPTSSTVLRLGDALEFCRSVGIPVAPFLCAKNPDQAADYANDLGLPVVLKLDEPEVVHRTEAGLVTGPLKDFPEVLEAGKNLIGKARYPEKAFLIVQSFLQGVELLIGVTRLLAWGPVMAIGSGGIYTEAINDIQYLRAPSDEISISGAFDKLRTGAILGKYRGKPAADLEQTISTAVVVSKVAAQIPAIREIEVNPFIAARGCKGRSGVVDVRVVLFEDAPEPVPIGEAPRSGMREDP